MTETRRFSETTGNCLICLLAVVLVLGVSLNLLILIVYRPNRHYNASVFLLFSLAAGNCVSALVLPPILIAGVILEYSPNINQSTFFCGVIHFFRYFIAQMDIAILLLISFERYRKLKYMNGTKMINKNLYNSKKALLCFFVASFLVSVFCFFFYEIKENFCVAKSNNPLYLIYSCTVRLLGLIGYLVMAFFYTKSYWIWTKNNRVIGIQEISTIDVSFSRNKNSINSCGTSFMSKKEWNVAIIFIRVINIFI